MLKRDLQQLIMNELNDNTEGVRFSLGKLGQTNASTFVIERFGDPDTNPAENWYEVITEEFVPVVTNNFDAVYLFDNQFKRRTYLTRFSFLIKQEEQDKVLEVIDDFIEDIVGTQISVQNYNAFFEPQDIRFVNTLVLNDIKFLEFELPLTIQLAEFAFFGSALQIGLKLPADTNYTNVNIINYAPSRVNQTVPVQYVGRNSSTSIVQSSIWTATLQFYVRTSDYYNSEILENIITQLEDSSSPMNSVYNLRIYNPISDEEYLKNVLITSITMPIQRENIITMTISLEEANSEVI